MAGDGAVLSSGRRGGRRPRRLAVALILGALLIAALAVGVREVTRSDYPGLTESPVAIGQALHERLSGQGLNVRAVQCVTPHRGAATYRGTRVLRCGVNFGDPHMPVYCATVVSGGLITDRQAAGLRC